MKVRTYKDAVKRTNSDLGSDKLNIVHMTLGFASEAAELVECLQSASSGVIDKVNLAEEIGDKFWYAFNYANIRNIDIPSNIFWDSESTYNIGEIVIWGGRLADVAKRYLAYGQDFAAQETKRRSDLKHIFYTEEEMLLNYLKSLNKLINYYGLEAEQIMGKNIVKLYIRYKDKFSEDAALVRDLEAERAALEA